MGIYINCSVNMSKKVLTYQILENKIPNGLRKSIKIVEERVILLKNSKNT